MFFMELIEKRTLTTYEDSRALIIALLDIAFNRISAGQFEFEHSFKIFYAMAEKLTTLRTQLSYDFDSRGCYFRSILDKTFTGAFGGLGNTDFAWTFSSFYCRRY